MSSSSTSAEAYQQRYSPGTRIWLPSKEKVWIPAKVTTYSPTSLVCEQDDGSSQSQTVAIKTLEKDLPPLRNPDILIGQNDLTSLSYLHEPAVLYNLEYRFSENNFIYTYCGIVLVAINPYDELPIYGKDTIWAYRGRNWGELDPHIFAVAEDAFTKMERENRDQSIIVSGESGAGKTVSAKYAMRYFATVGGSENETQIERKVLASSPIMEAIGNAKTTRNDNSSRFGKYVEVNFDSKYSIIGASMRTYLLEKSRVVFQSEEERNYHIFYQLCASRATHPEVSELFLSSCSDFQYTAQGRAGTIDGVSDEKLFVETVEAMTLLGFGIDDRRNFFKLLAAILHLGNVQISSSDGKPGSDSASAISKDDPYLKNFANILQVDFESMRKWLTCRKIVTGREEFIKPMSKGEASNSRDALSKLLYAEAFTWIVTGINRCLLTSQKTTRFIGVLDIYGFETFEINSFEQFCINYANEKLQQQFNQHVFKLEQEEYVKEEIEWTFIEFYDNQPCIDLIESKLGILDLLDEECRMPKGSEASWCQKLYQKCGVGGHAAHFEKPRMSQTAFIVVHFADRVQYESQGFLEKNRDTVISDQIMTVADSKNTWISALLEPKDLPQSSAGAAKGPKPMGQGASAGTMSTSMRKKTVGSQFRDSLTLLMQSLNATTPHYVRCIKPNDSKTPFEFDPHRAVQQLRACGVLETIRISAAGFPSRWTYGDFFGRYRPLVKCSKDINRTDHRQTCQKIVEGLISDEDQYRFGKSKIFFRAGQVAYLEKIRMDKMRSSAVIIQKIVKGFIYKKRYGKIKKAVGKLQCHGRGMLARRLALRLRQTRAAIRIQTCYRRWSKQRKFRKLREMTIGLQSRCRGYLARRMYEALKREKAALLLQRWIRGWLARKRCDKKKRNVVLVQSCVRRWLAKRRLRELKTEAKSLEHVKQLNKGLENKIISLQQKIEELTKGQGQNKKMQKDYERIKVQVENFKHMEKDLKAALEKITEMQDVQDKLEQELQIKMEAEVDFVTTKVEMESENERLRVIMRELNERMEKTGVELEESRKREDETRKIKMELATFEKERESEQQSYQQMLKKVHDMEQQLLTGPGDSSKPVARPTPVPRRNLAPASLDSGHPSLDRSPSPQRRALGGISSTSPQQIQQNQAKEDNTDIGLVLVLQQKLKQAEKERDSFEKLLEDQSATNPDSEARRTQDLIRLQELEMENAKLRDDLNKLRSTEDKTTEISRQFESLQEELARKREESIQLRTVLASPKGKKSPDGSGANGAEELVLNGDDENEIGLILQTQKKIIQQLEMELQAEKMEKKDFSKQIKTLEEQVGKQSMALSQALAGGGDLYLRNEVGRLTGENLTLRDQVDRLKSQLKRQIKQQQHDHHLDSSHNTSTAGNLSLDHVYLDIKKKPQDYLGMLEYRQEDEGKIMRSLIIDLQPAIALSAQPSGLPAFILFMMIRYTDYINDDNKVRSLLTSAITYIKRLMRKKGETLDVAVLWLSNILRFLHTLKQYSGDQAFQQENSSKQNEQCLKNFDLSEYRQVLSDHAVWIYMMLLKILEQDIQTMIVPAILENAGVDAGGGGGRKRGGAASGDKQKPLENLIRKMDVTYNLLCSYGLDVEVINQVFRQLFYYVCAGALNNLLLRRELCNWSKGLDIRYNVSALEEWGRGKKMEDVVRTALNPVIQASKILQARKSDNEVDVGTICETCEDLSIQQVVKLLNLYSSKDGIGSDKVSKTFIELVQQRLLHQRSGDQQQQEQLAKTKLLMDTQFTYAVKFPFNPSSVKLEEVNIPESFGVDQWITKK